MAHGRDRLRPHDLVPKQRQQAITPDITVILYSRYMRQNNIIENEL